MTVKIRPVTDADRPRWEAMFAAYATFYKTSVPDGGFDRVWDWIFDPANDFWCDVAQADDGDLVGFTQYQLMHRSLGASMVCYLSDLYVDPAVRGHGAGRAMIDHVRDFASARGLPGVRWLTQEFNYPARRLYDTYGPKTDFILYNVPT
ncbi:MAG: GNAT family N-acetyltransferase [Burkholderiaceae bacterium]